MEVVVTFAEALQIAIDHLQRGAFVETEGILRKLLRVKPGHEFATDLLIQSVFNQGKAAEAMELYDEAVGRGAYACDAEYNILYRKAVLLARCHPSPLRRRAKFRTLLDLVTRTLDLDGDVAECGCYRGLSSYLILSRIRSRARGYNGAGFHILDSFQGLSEPTSRDAIDADDPNAVGLAYMSKAGSFSASLEEVRQALAEFPGVAYHPGWIPDSFRDLPERRYRFVHLDVDLHDPTRAALEYFHPRMVRGGIMVCDDYGWPGARLAIEEYCSAMQIDFTVTEHKQAVMALP